MQMPWAVRPPQPTAPPSPYTNPPPSSYEEAIAAALTSHETRLQNIEGQWPVVASNINRLAEHAQNPEWVVHVAKLQTRIGELNNLVTVLTVGLFVVAGLSGLSVAYLSSQIKQGGINNVQAGP